MTPDETLAVLLVLSNRMPGEHVIPDRAMALAWHPDVKGYDSGLALNVAYSWADKFPAAGDFLAALQAEARRNILARPADPATPRRGKPSADQIARVHSLIDKAKRSIYDRAIRAELADPMDQDF